ncbi:MAG: diguanylate cyclase, partial [Thiobacillus sp.]|nr:diguanylate cyclase [Thiobacillus sp.]
MTNFVRNALHGEFAAAVTLSRVPEDAQGQEIRANADRLHPKVQALIKNSDVIKVKAYDRSGLTVYSTDLTQLGERIDHKPGFQAAIHGQVASDLKYRDVYSSAHDGERVRIDFIASYVPMRDQNGNICGVFEIYREVTALVQRVERTLWQVAIAAAAALTLLYLLQLLVVRHAQRILRLQAAELQTSNLELDRRVQERTAALEGEIAERRHVEKRLAHLAHHDPLTGLPNRLMFKEHLSQCLSRAARQQSRLAVLFIDLDRFKDVNDTLGHSVGDELLVAVTRRVKTCVRTSDILARQGGDEFICILEDIANQDAVEQVADKLLALFRQPFTVGGNELCLSGSIGICIAPDDGNEVDILVRNADAAMYRAKAQGRNRYHFYTVELTRQAQERMRLETLLRHAIEANELSVHFQPKVDAGDSSLTGAEALLRWN